MAFTCSSMNVIIFLDLFGPESIKDFPAAVHNILHFNMNSLEPSISEMRHYVESLSISN